MSCNHCTTKFNFFHKEMGCSNCGLSFCNRCLKQKCKIPSKGSSELAVCKVCHAKLSAGCSTQVSAIPPPDAYLKRVELFENSSKFPVTLCENGNSKIQAQLTNTTLSPVDQQLYDRLEKLKEDKTKGPPPSESELRRRLAELKGVNEYVKQPNKLVLLSDTRTEQQKVDNLLEKFVNERDIELAHNPQEEIEARLARLREQGVRPNEGTYISNLHESASSSEDEVDKITKKIMDEVALEEKCPVLTKSTATSDTNEEERTSPELPWCVLCNDDAKFRCVDCGGDLYCSDCNREVHKNLGDVDHTVIKFELK